MNYFTQKCFHKHLDEEEDLVRVLKTVNLRIDLDILSKGLSDTKPYLRYKTIPCHKVALDV